MKMGWKDILALVILVGAILVLALGCTANERARQFGGTSTVELPAGKKLVNATWKEGNNLWYVLRDAKPGESPETIEFIENSNYGMLNGKVVFVEHAKEK